MDLGLRRKKNCTRSQLIFHVLSSKIPPSSKTNKYILTLGGSGGGTFGLMIVLDLLEDEKRENLRYDTEDNCGKLYGKIITTHQPVSTEAMVELAIFKPFLLSL